MLDALGALDGNIMELDKAAWGRAEKALSQIKEVSPDVTPEEIARRARNYHPHFDAVLSSSALAKHWARCGATKQAQERPKQADAWRLAPSEPIKPDEDELPLRAAP